MIRNKKKTSKIMSVISALVAVVMLSTTVFASGALSDMAANDYTVEITNNDEKIELTNKPFVKNGEVYLPLRETIEKTIGKNNSNIVWNNNTVYLAIRQTNGMAGLYCLKIGEAITWLKHIDSDEISTAISEYSNYFTSKDHIIGGIYQDGITILSNGTTYLPIEALNYILFGFLNMRDENNKLCELTADVYDKNGNLIDKNVNKLSVGTIITDENNEAVFTRNLKGPDETVTGFFQAFSDSNFALMKNYCTAKCRSTFFGDEYCFGMTKADIQSMNIDPLEYAKSSNDFNVFVTVNMTPHEQSVFDPSETSTSFYVILQRQPDGRYLIDGFATGI